MRPDRLDVLVTKPTLRLDIAVSTTVFLLDHGQSRQHILRSVTCSTLRFRMSALETSPGARHVPSPFLVPTNYGSFIKCSMMMSFHFSSPNSVNSYSFAIVSSSTPTSSQINAMGTPGWSISTVQCIAQGSPGLSRKCNQISLSLDRACSRMS